jgi:hypothetical protein
MVEKVTHTIGLMDPNSLSFRLTLEGLFHYLEPEIFYENKRHHVKTRRIICRPYNTLGAKSSCKAILNRGAHWNPHHNSFFMMVMHHVYLLNDMISFNAIDKNTAYGQMYTLGLRIPKTWALPQQDNSELLNNPNVNPSLVFSDYELFDLLSIGKEVGYPAYLKPQSGGGWVGVEYIQTPEELTEKYNLSGDRPMNLQQAVPYREFVRTVGIGPQMLLMHFNPKAKYPYERYRRSEEQIVDLQFLQEKEKNEISKITKIINAFYGWDHNSCEVLIGEDQLCYPIDYANAYPDSTLISLHYYFPELVKAMVRWLLFIVVTDKKKHVDFAYQWTRYFHLAEQATQEAWDYEKKLSAYSALADEHFETQKFRDFCENHLKDFEERTLTFFESEEFFLILRAEIKNHFKFSWEIPKRLQQYEEIHRLWIHDEKERLKGNPLFPQPLKI